MQHRLRNIVWRELPYSARRSIVGVLRALDDFEAFWIGVWRSLTYSPAWIFVAICGGIGIVLTILLFFLLTQELLAGTTQRTSPRPLVEAVVTVVSDSQELDTRLCLDDVPLKAPPYPAEFGYGDAIQLADRTPIRRPSVVPVEVDEPDFAPPLDNDPFPDWPTQPAAMTVDAGEPTLLVAVNQIVPGRTPIDPLAPAQVLTAHSQSPLGTGTRLREFDALLSDDWMEYHTRADVVAPEPYVGDRSVVVSSEELNGDDFTAWPNRADLGLHLELYAPEQISAGQAGRSKLTIENTGDDTIRRVEIQEPMHPLGLVTHAEPPASVQQSTLYRELRRLGARRQKSLEIDWVPQGIDAHEHAAMVLAEAYVAAMVDVRSEQPERIAVEPAVRMEPAVTPIESPVPEPTPEPIPEIRRPPRRSIPAAPPVVPEEAPVYTPPPATAVTPEPQPALLCRVSHARQVSVNGLAEVAIEVQNTGNVPLTDVKIFAAIPENLRHKHGEQVEYAVGNLPAGEVQRAVLRMVGQVPGTSTTQIVAMSEEARSNAAQAVLAVTPRAVSPEPQPVPSAMPTTLPGCRCQRVPSEMTWNEYGF
ncbi:hypothetical protein GC163_02110 [bacterium]|nr:hypothetical protein [bacterium]